MINKILFVGNYPNPTNENLHIFFKNLICAVADLGVECCVISPVSVTKYRKKLTLIPQIREEITKKGNKVTIYYPRFVSMSSKNIGFFKTMHTTHKNYIRATITKIKELGLKFDAAYGHFFLSGGLTAIHIGEKIGVPAFVAYGESSYKTQVTKPYGDISKKELSGLSGIVSVSQKNSTELLEKGIFNDVPIFTCENAVDMSLFNRLTREQARAKFNFSKDDFIVGFVGSFIERKGDKRILEACKDLSDVKLAFAGKGDTPPSGENVIFCDSVNHDEIGDFLAAIDVFCLPTLNEGCCNAVLEAMAAGKAIISSDMSFNDNVLTSENSIRLNPNSIEEIREAIVKLRDDKEYRERLASKAKEDSLSFTIEKRAEKILNFMNSVSK